MLKLAGLLSLNTNTVTLGIAERKYFMRPTKCGATDSNFTITEGASYFKNFELWCLAKFIVTARTNDFFGENVYASK